MVEHQLPRFILSSPKLFFYLTKEGEFYDKWMGLWSNTYKIIDYLAIKIEDQWLNSKNIIKSERKNSRELILVYAFNNKEIKVLYSLSSYGLKIKVVGIEKFEVEIGINIRVKEENYHLREYEVQEDTFRDVYVFKDEYDRKVVIGLKEGKIKLLNKYYKEHYPYPHEKQRCLVSIFNIENNEFFITYSKEKFDKYIASQHEEEIKKYKKELNNEKDKLNIIPRISQQAFVEEVLINFKNAIDAVLSLRKEHKGKVFYVAGLPWFNEFWARDALWASFALIGLDKKDDVEQLLFYLSKHINEEGHMLTRKEFHKNSGEYHGDDVLPLYLIVLKYYVSVYGNEILEKKEIKEVFRKTKKYLEKHVFNGLVMHRSTGTWMDSVAKEWIALDIQALWVKALKCWKHLDKKFNLYYEILLKGLLRFYREGSWYRFVDPLSNNVAIKDTANAFLLTFLDIVHGVYAKAVLENGKKLISQYGVALENPDNITFNEKGYHSGASWLLVTGWALVSYLYHGYEEEAKKLFNVFFEDRKRFSEGTYSEVLAWNTGELIGCGHQLWSASILLFALTFGLFGINISKNLTLSRPLILRKIAKKAELNSSLKITFENRNDECVIIIHNKEIEEVKDGINYKKLAVFKKEAELYDIARKA